MDNPKMLVALGLILVLVGFAMPTHITQTKEKCVEPAGHGACNVGGFDMVEVTKENDFRIPTIVGGGILAVIGVVLLDKEERTEAE